MSGISQKKRSSISRIIHTAKQPKMTATSIPKLPQMSNVDKGSSLVFDPLSLRYSVNNRRCQAPSPHSDQPPKEFHHVPAVKVHQTKIAPTPSVTGMSKPDKITLWNTKVGSKSTEGSFQSSSEKERAQPTINARRSVFAGGVSSSHKRQNPPSDLVDDVQVHHNREKERKESQEEYTTDKSTQRSFSDEHEIENDAREFSQTEDDSRGRGPCKQIKTSRMVRLSKHRIEVSYNKVTERATSAEIHSLLVHDVGAIVRSHCPMDTGFWGKIPLKDREDLMGEITINFEDPDIKDYINSLYNGRYREFKAELSKYYKLCETHEIALTSPPPEMVDRDPTEWEWLCNHFNSDKFKNASSANTSNRSNKKNNHRTGSRPFSYIVEDMIAEGSKFPEVAAFEITYAGKDKCWTNEATKEQHEKMVAKANEYLAEKAKEYQLPEDTPLEEMPIDDPDIGLEIMTSVLGTTPGHLRDTRATSKKVKNLEKELEGNERRERLLKPLE